MNGRLIVPIAVLTGLVIGPALAQNRGGIAIPSENPGSGITFGQNGNLSFVNPGGGGGQGASRFFFGPQPLAPSPGVRANNGFAAQGFVSPGFTNSNFGFVNPNTGFVNPNTGFANQGFVNSNFPGFASPNFGSGFVAPSTPTTFVDPNTGLITSVATGFNGNGFNSGLGTGFNGQFGNGFNGQFGNGFNSHFFDPTLGGFVGNTGFAPGFFPGAAVTFGPTGWGEPMDPGMAMRSNMGTVGRSPAVRVLGINTPAPPLTGRISASGRTRVDLTPKTPEDFAARRLIRDQDEVASRIGAADQTEIRNGTIVATGPSAERGPVRRAPATREQIQLADRAEQLMADRPMRQGLVVKLNGDTVDVSYECKGESRTEAFPAGEVFFFRASGTLATAATAKSALQIGDRVLVACEEERPRQAVAGSRQEMRGSDASKSPAAAGSTRSGGTTGRTKSAPGHKHYK